MTCEVSDPQDTGGVGLANSDQHYGANRIVES